MAPLLGIIIGVLEYYRRHDNDCGIPVKWWVEIWFIIPLCFLFLQLQELWMLKCCRTWVMPYMITCIVLYLLAFAVLTLHGLGIYFSDDNDCQDHSDTSTYLVFMIIFMFFGCFLTLILCVLCIVGPIIYYQFRDGAGQSGKLREGQIG